MIKYNNLKKKNTCILQMYNKVSKIYEIWVPKVLFYFFLYFQTYIYTFYYIIKYKYILGM